MKNFVILFALVVSSFVAMGADDLNYVIVDGKTYFSEEMKIGMSKVRITTDEGLTLKAPLKKVDSYMIDGKVCDRLPLVCSNGKVKATALLELVAHRNGLRLYKYHSENSTLGSCLMDKDDISTLYFIYKNGELHLRVNENNAETVLTFFGIPVKGVN